MTTRLLRRQEAQRKPLQAGQEFLPLEKQRIGLLCERIKVDQVNAFPIPGDIDVKCILEFWKKKSKVELAVIYMNGI